MNLAQLVDAVPVVQNTADRAAKFPNPLQDQRVWNKGTGNTERFDLGAWVVDSGGAAAALGWFNFKDAAYGGVAGGPDNATALNTVTAAAVAAGGGVVYLPAGFFYFTTTPTALAGTLGVIFMGAGRNVTHLIQGANAVNIFTLGDGATRVQLRDMWIGSLQARAAGFGIFAQGGAIAVSELIVERVTFQNLPNAIYLDKTTGTFQDVRYLQTIVGATAGVVFYMIRCNGGPTIRDFSAFCTAGSFPNDVVRVDSDCDTVTLYNSQIALGGNGPGAAYRFMNSVGGASTGPRLCRLTDCYGENCAYGFLIEAARDVRLRGCHTANSTNDGFLVTGGDSVTLTDCFATANGHHGFGVTGGNRVKIEGCTAADNSTAADNTYDGFHLDTVTGVRLVGNAAGNFIYGFANRQRYGMYIGAATDYIYAALGDMRGNQTSSFASFSTGSHNVILDENTWTRTVGKIKTITDAVTIADVDPRLGTIFTVTLAGDRTMGVALDGANWVAGQRITFLITQDGPGGRTLAWHGSYKQSWSDAGNTSGKRSSISFVNAGDGTWAQDGAQVPYV